MTIELKNIKVNLRLSEETFNYSATLYFKGKKIGEVGNHGTGGPDEYIVFSGSEKAWAEMEEYIAGLPTEVTNIKNSDGTFWEMKPDLETIAGDIVSTFLDTKELDKKLKTRLVYTKEDGKVYESKVLSKEALAKFFANEGTKKVYASKWGVVSYLNEMPKEEALKVFRAA